MWQPSTLLSVSVLVLVFGSLPTLCQTQCDTDLAMMQNLTYPYGDTLRTSTGQGNYGLYVPFNNSYFDPGKWVVCTKHKEQMNSQYCYFKHTGSQNGHGLYVGACVPASCNASYLNQLSVKNQAPTVASALRLPDNFAEGYFVSCDEASYDLPWTTYCMLALYVFLFSLMAIGTALDVIITQKPFASDHDENSLLMSDKDVQSPKKAIKLEDKHPNKLVKILLCFSVTYNTERLLAPSPPGSFDVLNGVRVIAMAFVVLGHTFYFLWDTMSVSNFQEIYLLVRSVRFQVVVAGFYAVDTFFFLSGFLVAYLFIKELQTRGISLKMMFMFYFHRVYRLTPSLFMGMMFYWLITPYWSSGPYWLVYQKFVSSHCDDGWWYTLLYIQNFVDPSNLCMGWSWYLADDMQYYILSPLVLILYWKNKHAGWFVSILGILVCIACNLGITAENDLDEMQVIQHGAEIGYFNRPPEKMGRLIYLPPWTRVAPYFVGFCCAFFLLERGTKFKVPRIPRGVIYLCSSSIILVLSFITYSDANYGWAPWMNVVWIGFSRTMWSIGLGVLLLVCIAGYGGVFNAAMSAGFWVPLARLSYGAYIYHLSNISTIYNGYKAQYTLDFPSVMYFFIGHLLVAFFLAYVNYILVEKPLMNIETVLLHRAPKKLKEPEQNEPEA